MDGMQYLALGLGAVAPLIALTSMFLTTDPQRIRVPVAISVAAMSAAVVLAILAWPTRLGLYAGLGILALWVLPVVPIAAVLGLRRGAHPGILVRRPDGSVLVEWPKRTQS